MDALTPNTHTTEKSTMRRKLNNNAEIEYQTVVRDEDGVTVQASREAADTFDLRLVAFGYPVTFTPNIDRGGWVDREDGDREFAHAERVAMLLADAPDLLDLLREIVDRVEGTPGAALPLDLDTHVRGLLARHSRFGG